MFFICEFEQLRKHIKIFNSRQNNIHNACLVVAGSQNIVQFPLRIPQCTLYLHVIIN